MITFEKPTTFFSRFDVVGCFVRSDAQFLFLERHQDKPQGLTWCLPGGKVDVGETIDEAMERELAEETNIIALPSTLSYFTTGYVYYAQYDYIYHIFTLELKRKPKIKINPSEHRQFAWVTPKEALAMDFIPDLDACIKLLFKV